MVTREKNFRFVCVCFYLQSADVRFAVLQLISAARNELGLIRHQSAHTATLAVGIAYRYWLSLYILYSELPLNGHLSKTDTKFGPVRLLIISL